MITNKMKVAIIGILLILFGVGVLSSHAEESKSERIARLSNHLCRQNIKYLENSVLQVIGLYGSINVIEGKLPKDESFNDVRESMRKIAYEVDDLISDLSLQSWISSNGCTDFMFGEKYPVLANRNNEDTHHSKDEIIAGLRDEMCDIYVSNLAQVIYSLRIVIKELDSIAANGNVKVIAINDKIELTKIENDLKALLRSMEEEFEITRNVCVRIYENASKSDFWRTANMGRNTRLINPYLILLFIYD